MTTPSVSRPALSSSWGGRANEQRKHQRELARARCARQRAATGWVRQANKSTIEEIIPNL
jgi:hypothetical protein